MTPLLKLLVKKYGKYQLRKGMEYAFRCPSCQDTKFRMDVNLKMKVYHCYHCGEGGWISDLLPCSGEQPIKNYWDKISVKGDVIRIPIVTTRECPLPKGFKVFNRGFLPLLLHREFLKERNISLETAVERGWGYVSEGEYRFNARMVIPIYEDRRVICWVARAVFPRYIPKELSPEASVSNKSHFLYNLDLINEGDTVILVEGIFDCERMIQYGYKSVAVLGCHLSDIQVGKLLAKRPKKIYIMFDGDIAGREGGVEAFKKLVRRTSSLRLFRIILSEGKDPDDLAKEEVEVLIG